MYAEGRVAPVTGASRGIGAAIAAGLARDGADVAVGYQSDGDAASRMVPRIERSGRRAVAVGGDLRNPAAVERICDEAEDSLGSVEVPVSNAGIAPPQELEGISVEDWEEVIEVRTCGLPFCSQRNLRQGCGSGVGAGSC